MRELGLQPCQPTSYRHSLTAQDGQAGDTPDHVRRDFTAGRPGEKMVGDITYIPTRNGDSVAWREIRKNQLPARVVVYFVMAPALFYRTGMRSSRESSPPD
jgi:hypothetical protein